MAGELITGDGQVEWNGLILGAGTPYRFRHLTGWYDSPEVREDVENRPGRHGAFTGELRSGRRIVELGFTISPRAPREAVAALRRATAWDNNPVEAPLVVRLDGVSTMVSARVLRRSIPTDRAYAVGYAQGAVQWAASDPIRYGLALRRASTGLPEPASSGLAWPLAWPLDWGPGATGGELLISHAGDAHVWPVWEIRGPVTGPVITCLDSGARLAFAPDFMLAAGQSITIDTDDMTVLLGGTVSRRDQLQSAQWFPIPPDTTRRIGFTATSGYDVGARLTGYWRDGYL